MPTKGDWVSMSAEEREEMAACRQAGIIDAPVPRVRLHIPFWSAKLQPMGKQVQFYMTHEDEKNFLDSISDLAPRAAGLQDVHRTVAHGTGIFI